jgi:hypothetical protein
VITPSVMLHDGRPGVKFERSSVKIEIVHGYERLLHRTTIGE